VRAEAQRPAFYALGPGGWRDYVTLLHLPYTAWHLSYVAVGAALAPEFSARNMAPVLAAFFLALGVGAHALDELHGRPLRTSIPAAALVALAAVSISGAVALGLASAAIQRPLIVLFVTAGVFLVLAYNLELLGGRIHTDTWFALAWGAFPLLTAYYNAAGRIRPEALLAAAFAAALSYAQRRLSRRARMLRRETSAVSGRIVRADGTEERLSAAALLEAPEAALRAMAFASCALACALVLMRVA
jgi:hypothetical protein